MPVPALSLQQIATYYSEIYCEYFHCNYKNPTKILFSMVAGSAASPNFVFLSVSAIEVSRLHILNADIQQRSAEFFLTK